MIVAPARAENVIDTHVHFWDPGELTYPWLAGVAPLDRAYLPDEFARGLPKPPDMIFVEAGRIANQAEAEVAWVRRAADTRPWIRGVVAHADLESPSATAVIRRYAADPLVVGVRRNLQDEPPGFATTSALRSGVRLLGECGLPFDACVRAGQLGELADLADACPDTTIILDHLGKPTSGSPDNIWWQHAIRALARRRNVVCKLSGLTTEVAPGTSRRQLISLLHDALDAFGPERCMYGSDWPVMTLATTQDAWLDLVREALGSFAPGATSAALSETATRVYRLARETAPASNPL